MGRVRARAGRWIGLVVLGAYPFVMHTILILAGSSRVGSLLILAVLAAVAAVAILHFKRRLAFVLLALAGGVVLVRVGLLTADQAAGIKSWVIANPELAYTIGSAALIAVREFFRKRTAK